MWDLSHPNYKLNLARHNKSCSAGTLYCSQRPSFCRKPQNDLIYFIAEKHSIPKPEVTFKCKLCYQRFLGFYALRQHRNTQHGMQIGSRTTDVNVVHIVGDFENHSLREELPSCQHSWWTPNLKGPGTQILQWRSGNSQRNNSERKTWSFFNILKCAAKLNLVFGFILKNIEDGGFRYFYAHEDNTRLDWSNFVCAHDDLAKLNACFNKTDVIKSCSRETMNTKWRFYKLKNLTVFAVLLIEAAMGCKYAVLRKLLLRSGTTNCLTYAETTRQPENDNMCLFRAFILHLHALNDWEKKLQNCSIYSSIKWMDWAPINSKESISTMFLLLKIC